MSDVIWVDPGEWSRREFRFTAEEHDRWRKMPAHAQAAVLASKKQKREFRIKEIK